MKLGALVKGAAFAVALVVLGAGQISAAERLQVEFAKEMAGGRDGLERRYTFTVKKDKSGEPVVGAAFTVSGDMPSMPGMHRMRPVRALPGQDPGVYHAIVDFAMAGDWNLILRFSKPHRDQVILSDSVAMPPGGSTHDQMKMKNGQMEMEKKN